MKQFWVKHLQSSNWKVTIAGAVVGGLLGFLYWKFYGCENGCSITGSPINSSLYMAMMGALFPNVFEKEKNKSNKE
jgi:hypothetical protein